MTEQQGTVAFFDLDRGFGKITPNDGGDLVFLHISKVSDQPDYPLVPGEQVTYLVTQTDKGPQAQSVKRLSLRHSGTVDYFDRRSGRGVISPDEGDSEIPVHFRDVVSPKEYKALEDGQRVEYSIEELADGGHRAVRVLPDTRSPLERFAVLPSFDKKIETLAALAPEDWDYKFRPSTRKYPILYNYIHYTFKRVQEEGKIAFALGDDRKQLACFNTGLVTAYYDPIFAAFTQNNNAGADKQFVLLGFFTESQSPITFFGKRPELAYYFDDPAELIYDRRLTLVRNVRHIVEDRLERFPAHLQADKGRLAGLVDNAIVRAEQRVLRNYKTAIPQFNQGRIQLLLPLCLEDPTKADVALVVGKEGAVYKGYTVLTLDMAYNNARLLTRPDREWLLP